MGIEAKAWTAEELASMRGTRGLQVVTVTERWLATLAEKDAAISRLEGILRVHMRNKPIAEDVNIDALAKSTPGMAGADLANLVNEGALLAARRNHDKIYMADFEDAKDKVMLGAERKSLVMKDEERRLTAYHEGGHALVAHALPNTDPVHKISIIPRGRALEMLYTGSRIDAAEALYFGTIKRAMNVLENGGSLTPTDLVTARRNVAFACKLSLKAGTRLFNAGGGRALRVQYTELFGRLHLTDDTFEARAGAARPGTAGSS